MLKKEKDDKLLIDKAIEESNMYLEMYQSKLNYYVDYLKKFEEEKDEYIKNSSIFNYEIERNSILENIKKYKIEIDSEKDSINRMLSTKKVINKSNEK